MGSYPPLMNLTEEQLLEQEQALQSILNSMYPEENNIQSVMQSSTPSPYLINPQTPNQTHISSITQSSVVQQSIPARIAQPQAQPTIQSQTSNSKQPTALAVSNALLAGREKCQSITPLVAPAIISPSQHQTIISKRKYTRHQSKNTSCSNQPQVITSSTCVSQKMKKNKSKEAKSKNNIDDGNPSIHSDDNASDITQNTDNDVLEFINIGDLAVPRKGLPPNLRDLVLTYYDSFIAPTIQCETLFKTQINLFYTRNLLSNNAAHILTHVNQETLSLDQIIDIIHHIFQLSGLTE